jgi:predicted permease
MSGLRVFLARLAGLLNRRGRDRALDDELESHLDLLTDEYVRQGANGDDARRMARRAMGRLEAIKEAYRRQRGLPIVDTIGQDLRFAMRVLGRHRGFTLAAAGTLAVGIGVNTTFFTIVNAICVRGLPIERPDDVLVVNAVDARGRQSGLSYADFEDVRRGATRFGALAAYRDAPMTVGDADRAPDRVTGTYISAGAFRLLGRPPAVGREFTAEDDRAGAAPVALLSHELWMSRYAGDRSVVGRLVNVNGIATAVVGIVPDGFRFPVNSNLWVPLAATPELAQQPRDARGLTVAGRLAGSGVLDDARDELDSIGRRLAESYPATNRGVRLTARPINDAVNGRITDPVWIAFITAGVIVLLVSWANVATLHLMRSTARARELAIRTSMGASRFRLVRQLLVECTVLSALGGGLGLLLSKGGTWLLDRSVPTGSPLPFWIEHTVDGRVLTVVIGTAVAAVFVCGLIPALQASDVRLPRALRIGRLGAATTRTRWLTSGFLAAELGLAFVLVANVAMAVQGLLHWQRRPVLDARPLLTAAIALPADAYRTTTVRAAFYDALADRLRSLPGVSSVSVASHPPLIGAAARQVTIETQKKLPGLEPDTVQTIVIGSRYFEAIGLPMVQGRAFTDRDGITGQDVVVVNQRFADVHVPAGNALGQRLQLSAPGGGDPSPWLTIVGIAPTIRRWTTDDGNPTVYLPVRSDPPAVATLILRVEGGEPASMAPAVREAVRQLDANVPLFRIASLEQAIHDSNWNGRVSHRIILSISTIALALALIGQVAVTAQSVTTRTQELGLRIAVGARPGHIVGLVLRRVLLQVSAGLALGVFLLFALSRFFPAPESLDDARMLVIVGALITIVALASCIVPARRAARIDPVTALRAE